MSDLTKKAILLHYFSLVNWYQLQNICVWFSGYIQKFFHQRGFRGLEWHRNMFMNREYVTLFKGSAVGCWEITAVSPLVWKNRKVMEYLNLNRRLANGDTERHLHKTSVKCNYCTCSFRELLFLIQQFYPTLWLP